MLQQLDIKNFTVFQNADLTFANGLNVVIGENSSGKTHILKLAYSIIAASAEAEKSSARKPRPRVFYKENWQTNSIMFFGQKGLGDWYSEGKGGSVARSKLNSQKHR